MEMRSHSGPISTTSGLASHLAIVPSEDLFEPREDSLSSGSTGEPTVGSTNGSTGVHTEATTNEPNDGTPTSSNGCDQNGTAPNNVPHDAEPSSDPESSHKDSNDSEFSYQQLCDNITTAVNCATRKLSHTTVLK